jgi:hypothetical protein
MLLPFNSFGLYPFPSGMSMPMARLFLLFRLIFQEGALHQKLPCTRKSMAKATFFILFRPTFFDLRHYSLRLRSGNDGDPATLRRRSRHCPCGRNLP